LPLIDGGKISVVHVLPDRLPDKTRAEAEKAARYRLGKVAAALSRPPSVPGGRKVQVSSGLYRGQAYVEIIRHARAAGADLIVLGRHGRRPVRDMFIGSTAERVIRAGNLPVLVVSGRATRSYRRPCLAVDLGDTCRSVAVLALRVLGPEIRAVTLIHAYHVPFEGLITPGVAPGRMTELRRECRRRAVSVLARLRSSLGDLGVRWQTVIVLGDPRTTILAAANRRRADLLAVGTHGRSGLSHALVGSVAERVIQAAACDVLVTRPARVTFEFP
jgi:nucleotide-binding universal stress UspA family protein